MTGRFLMDHPKCVLGVFDPDDDHDIRQVLGLYNLRRRGGQAFTHGVALSPALQRRERLLNCAAWLTEQRSPDDPWEALKRVAVGTGGQARDIAAVARNLPFALKGATHYLTRGRGVLHKCESILLEASVEQEPNPESRVTLSSSLDAFGEPLARIDWKIGELELKTLIAFGEVIVAEFRRLGLPAPRLADWIRDRDPAAAPMRDAAHPIGATRMSVDPADGVVDPDCKVHGIDGLYVGGSSVFPTAGHANPTLMAVALAVRLADKLKASKP
jgi:choline dehydrogenase-like flavoprotein